MIFILVTLFFVLALRGPPLDENLLLSNIATANKKVEHLTEVTLFIEILFGLYCTLNYH